MSSEVSLKISANTTDFISNVQKAQQATDQLNQSIAKTGGQVGQATQAYDKTAAASDKVAKSTQSMGQRIQQAGTGFTLVGASAISLWSAYDNVSDAAKRVEIAHTQVARANLNLSRAQEDLVKKQKDGKTSALDLQQAQEKVRVASGLVERAEFNLTNQQEALNEAWLQSATSIIPAVFTGVSGLSQAMTALKGTGKGVVDSFTQIGSTATQVGSSATKAGSSMVAMGANAAEAATATSDLSSAAVDTGASMATMTSGALQVGDKLKGAASGAKVAADSFGLAGREATAVGRALTITNGPLTTFVGSMGPLGNNARQATDALLKTEKEATKLGKAATFANLGIGGLGKSLLLLGGIAGAAFGSWIALTYAQERNIGGLDDAMQKLRASVDDVLGTVPGWQGFSDAMSENNKSIQDNIASIVEGDFVMDSWITRALGMSHASRDVTKEEERQKAIQAQLNAETEKYRATFDKFSPSVLQLAKDFGIYYDAQLANTDAGRSMTASLQQQQAAIDKARTGTIALATANGVDLNTAVKMTNEEMANWLLTAGELGPTAEQAAADTAAAAAKMSDAWQQSFDKILEAQQEGSSLLASGADTVWKEMGDNIKVGLNDLKMDIAGGGGFATDFWEKVFPAQIADNAWKHAFNKDELIDDMDDLKKRAIDKGMITKESAAMMFDPLLNYVQHELPGDSRKALGALAGTFEGAMARFRPIVLRGFEMAPEVGGAVQRNIVDPMVTALKGLGTGESGIDFGPKLVKIIQGGLPAVRAVSEDMANMIQGILDSTLPMYDTTEEKIQAITGILGEMGLGFDDMIMGVNEDGDKYADIMDTQILKPSQEAALEMAKMWRAVFAGIPGMDKVVQNLDAYINKLEHGASSADDFAAAHFNAKKPINGINAEVYALLTPLERMTSKFLNGRQAIIKATAELNSYGRSLNDLTGMYEGNIAAFDKWADTLDLSKLKDNNIAAAKQQDLWSDEDMKTWATGAGEATTPTQGPTIPPANTKPFQDSLDDIIDRMIPDFITQVGMAFGQNWSFDQVKAALGTGPNSLAGVIGGAVNQILPGIGSYVTAIISQFLNNPWDFGGLIQVIAGGKTGLGGAIGTAVNNILPGIQSYIGPIIAQFTASPWDFSGLVKVISSQSKGLGNSIGQAINQVLPGIPSYVTAIISQFVSNPWDFGGLLSVIGTGLGGAIGEGVNRVLPGLGSYVTAIVKQFGVGWTWDDVYNAIGADKEGTLLGTLKGGIQTILDYINNTAVPTIQGALKGIGDFFQNPIKPAEGALPTDQTGQQPGQAPTTGEAQKPPDFSAANQAWADYQAFVNQTLVNIQTAWINHITNFSLQFVAPLTTLLQAAADLYAITYAQQVAATLGGVVITLGGHITAVNATLVQPLATALTTAGQFYLTAYANQVGVHLGVAIGSLVAHAQAVGGQVDVIGGHLIRLATGFDLVRQQADDSANRVAQAFNAMANSGNSSINRLGMGLSRLATGLDMMRQQADQSADRTAKALNAMANSGVSSVNRLASAVRSAMSRIVASMNSAASAAKNLQSAINALKNKTITVTTVYKTVGSKSGGAKGTARARAHGSDEVITKPTTLLVGEAGPEHVRVTPLAGKRRSIGAANGFSGVVTEPTRFFTGEGNKPELVQITPLSGEHVSFAKTQATSAKGSMSTIRAGRGAKKAVSYTEYYENGKKIIYYTDGSRKKSHYKIHKGENWRSAAARDSGEPYVRDIEGRGDYVTPDGRRYKSEDMYDFEKKKEADIIKKKEDKENKTGKDQKPPTTTYTYVTKSGKVKKKEVVIDPETGSAIKHSAKIEQRIDTDVLGKPHRPSDTLFMKQPANRGRFGIGGIWQHEAFGGKGDMFPYPIPEGFKKTLSKTYYPDGSVWNNYSDGSREMITPPRHSKDKKKKKAARGFHGMVNSPTQFTVGEGGRAEMINIEPLSGGKSLHSGGPGANRPVTIQLVQDQPIIVDGRQIARIVRDYELRGYSAIT